MVKYSSLVIYHIQSRGCSNPQPADTVFEQHSNMVANQTGGIMIIMNKDVKKTGFSVVIAQPTLTGTNPEIPIPGRN
ncbi:MAG: hypothetical protein ACD_34C00516G0003 [uncultured bacterium]|nr:MAG: hypothetical protein ACD_34C00516G0003 [uncultured bacterium]